MDQTQQRYNIVCNSEITNKYDKLQRYGYARYVMDKERNELIILNMNLRSYARVF
jgi:hypothetical protein